MHKAPSHVCGLSINPDEKPFTSLRDDQSDSSGRPVTGFRSGPDKSVYFNPEPAIIICFLFPENQPDLNYSVETS